MTREERRQKVFAAIPASYSPWAHLIVPSAVGAVIVVVALSLVRDLRAWELVTVPITFVLLNAAEWAVHRDLLHRRRPPMHLLYDRHIEHHGIFIEEDMAIRAMRELRLVLMPGPAIIGAFVASLPIPAILVAVGQRNAACLFAATTMLYLVSYELMHAAYHAPADSFVGRLRLVAVLRRHHAKHHHAPLMQKWNFNVTVPLWDVVRGTVWRADRADAVESSSSAPTKG
jgi:sterol desaturase/sphingolipid hydroxylase (fatty acid hydroxylase superfamily)